MNELIKIFNELESRGWVCVLKWDGLRSSSKKTILMNGGQDLNFSLDFDDFNQAIKRLRAWMEDEGIAPVSCGEDEP